MTKYKGRARVGLVLLCLILVQLGVIPYQPPGQSQPNQFKYNPYSGQWHSERPDSQLQYNPYNGKWDYARPGSQPQYNPYTGKWEQQK